MNIPKKVKIGAKVYEVEITRKLDLLGYSEHDEKKVDELANVLHMVIQDNPEIFAVEKKGAHTKNDTE